MYQLEGVEFAKLMKREFSTSFETTYATGSVPNRFDCYAQGIKADDFSILRFGASFEDGLRINNMQDATHVSIHFQLHGCSDARISGFDATSTMNRGQFNLLNCVNPVSSFVFPKQKRYEYVCVGLKPAFFNEILLSCGQAYDSLLQQSRGARSFALFADNKKISHLQSSGLSLLTEPPVADSLRNAYIKTKITELTLLTLSGQYENKDHSRVNPVDVEKLQAAKEHLSTHYLDDMSLRSLSRDFLLNEFKLKAGFKKLFGTTVFGYVQSLRMNHALTLMRGGGTTVGEAAVITGYRSDASFIRAFKQYHGYSPGTQK
jgi:AraC family transcriptional activator of pyochelin receptor